MKYLLFVFVFLMSCPATYAGCKTVITSGGNPINDTYRDVTEGTLNGNPCLRCLYPGSCCCEWKNGDGPGAMVIYVNGNPINGDQAWQMVLQNLHNGNLQGQVNGDNGIGHFNWNGEDEVNYTFNFDDGITN